MNTPAAGTKIVYIDPEQREFGAVVLPPKIEYAAAERRVDLRYYDGAWQPAANDPGLSEEFRSGRWLQAAGVPHESTAGGQRHWREA